MSRLDLTLILCPRRWLHSWTAGHLSPPEWTQPMVCVSPVADRFEEPSTSPMSYPKKRLGCQRSVPTFRVMWQRKSKRW